MFCSTALDELRGAGLRSLVRASRFLCWAEGWPAGLLPVA